MLSTLLTLLTLLSIPSLAAPSPSYVNQTTCNTQTYTYHSLFGYGSTPSNARDRYGDTAGGIGSSAAIDALSWTLHSNGSYTGILWALPDRGWNTEGTLNYQPRVHKFLVSLTPNESASVDDPAGENVRLEYLDSVLFSDMDGTPVTGLDPDFGPPYLMQGGKQLPSATYEGDGFGGAGSGGRRVSVDTEGLVLNDDGSFWVSDEYGPYIYHFSSEGKIMNAIAPPDAILPRRNGTVSFSADSPPRYDPERKIEPEDPQSGRSNNQGLEGLTASADGKYLFALLQSAATQEGGDEDDGRRYVRMLRYDVEDPAKPVYVAEYVVPLPLYKDGEKVAGQSEIKSISDTQFLILARDSGKGRGQGADDTKSRYRHADVFDISKATDIKGDQYDCATCSIASEKGKLKDGIVAATYCPFLDFNVNSELGKFGLHNGGDEDTGLLNEKWESFALVPVEPGKGGCAKSEEYFLFSLSDNDFITQDGYMKGGELPYADESGYDLLNQVLVFKVTLPKGSKPRIG